MGIQASASSREASQQQLSCFAETGDVVEADYLAVSKANPAWLRVPVLADDRHGRYRWLYDEPQGPRRVRSIFKLLYEVGCSDACRVLEEDAAACLLLGRCFAAWPKVLCRKRDSSTS